MRTVARLLVAALLGLACASSQAQVAALRLVGLDGAEQTISSEVWSNLPRISVTATEHDGSTVALEGVAARDLLRLAGAPLGSIRGKNAAVYVIGVGADGYQAVFALAEFDEAFTPKVVLLADRKDGKPLDAKEGPLRMIVPDEKRQARWVRNLSALILRRAE